ncbi:rRNA processing/ribosome biogenesis-domain-containing protein [Phaeosphaeriaceae sp. PMI808]|nr:rRNA processing/ribosome biogenesis-domain-containing protein [Phaeosphaeriaceae sp. PMI808]
MASIASELATLRALTFRVSSTTTSQLPKHVPAIVASLANCKTLLSLPQASAAKSSSESSVAVHKYRTLLSTLLQDRTVHGRWSAIVLIKATIEIGGWETLQKCLPWVRGLLGILTKPDPPSSKKLCVITLTRIFILTREYPTLVREITTPSLPVFIQSSLKIANSKTPAPLLQAILESFNELLPRHPTIFRSYLKQLHPFLAHLLAPTPSNKLTQEHQFELTSGVVSAAQQLYVQIPNCAPKGASSEDWEKSLRSTISSAHRVADKVFRAVIEDWHPTTREAATNGHTLEDEVQDLDPDNMALPVWSGIFAGSERLVQFFHLIQQFLINPTANTVSINISAVIDIITRALMLTIPGSSSRSYPKATKFNNQVTKEERENLWLVLPTIHVAAIEVLLVLASRSQSSTLPLDSIIIDQMVWLFAAERNSRQIRVACYLAVAVLIQRSGAGFSKSIIGSLVPLMRACCEDLLPLESATGAAKDTPGQAKTNGLPPAQAAANADTFLDSAKGIADTTSGFVGLKEAAFNLLPLLLANIPAQYLSDSLRGRLDRTAILTQHKHAMVASVLNPPPSKKFGKPAASILPLMARSFPASTEVESMSRPRMPTIRLGAQDVEAEEDEMDEDAEEDDIAEVEETVEEQTMAGSGDTHFVGHELDLLLQSAGRTNPLVSNPEMVDVPGMVASIDLDNGKIERQTRSSSTQAHLKDSGKRTHIDQTPPSPSKRVKFGEEAQAPILGIPPTSTAAYPSSTGPPEPIAVAEISGLPEPTETVLNENESDEDDIVSLVMGQDTDDDSD